MTTINGFRFRQAEQEYLFLPDANAIVEMDALSTALLDQFEAAAGNAEAAHRALQDRFAPEPLQEAWEELRQIGAIPSIRRRTPPLPPDLPLETVVLNIAHACNLTCRYCYAEGGNYGKRDRMMDSETAKAAVDLLMRSSADKDVTITFFGGEPLMNFPVVRETIRYALAAAENVNKRVDFSLTTNATLLDEEKIEFLTRHRVGISVSMDGPPEVHNANRKLSNGQDSYGPVHEGVTRLVARSTRPVAARVTITRDFASIPAIFDHLRALGFAEIGIAPVTSDDPALRLDEADLERMLDGFRLLTERFCAEAQAGRYLGFSNLSNLLVDLYHGDVRALPCGAGLGFVGIDPAGEIYLCHRFSGQDDFQWGHVTTGIDREKRAAFYQSVRQERDDDCAGCFLRNICAGGCYYEALTRQGDARSANRQYCNWLKQWYEIGLGAFVRLQREVPGFLEKLANQGKAKALQ
ncbi:SPASM domain-containing protein [Heliobacterium gestii]|uniref:SPASM domain-containing protein n=1 Tax=Heliomicrobium gestii TaxID=2699 RepID=A0A845LHN5_HELGE|nr:radical SAM protein [Heliomicrobium gestii]MBM7866231.1 uncharacterized protein [Heliomicrobium gestii]MZP42973.1 SPASM domain-containing protein [Heliomicrobium gestii]